MSRWDVEPDPVPDRRETPSWSLHEWMQGLRSGVRRYLLIESVAYFCAEIIASVPDAGVAGLVNRRELAEKFAAHLPDLARHYAWADGRFVDHCRPGAAEQYTRDAIDDAWKQARPRAGEEVTDTDN